MEIASASKIVTECMIAFADHVQKEQSITQKERSVWVDVHKIECGHILLKSVYVHGVLMKSMIDAFNAKNMNYLMSLPKDVIKYAL